MSIFEPCHNFTMDNEDAGREYKDNDDSFWTKDAEGNRIKVSARVISGINSHFYPEDYAKIAAIPQPDRGPAIEAFYQRVFWNSWLEQVIDQDLTMRIYDSTVNPGPGAGVKLIQQAVNALGGAQIDADGHWGPITLAAINNQNPARLLQALMDERYEYYQEHDAGTPSLAGLLARAQR